MKSVLLVGLLIYSASVQSNIYDARYYEVASVETREISRSDEVFILDKDYHQNMVGCDNRDHVGDFSEMGLPSPARSLVAGVSAITKLGALVKIGESVWKFVEKNKPVVNVTSKYVSVLPNKMPCWLDYSGWRGPSTRTYQTTYKNAFGVKVVNFRYKLLYFWGGHYEGQGRYLAKVTAIPELVEVAWAYKFNAEISVPSILNFGTVDDPLAGAQVEVHWSVDTVLKHEQNSVNFMVYGDGSNQML